MEGVIQRTSSQPKQLDANSSHVGVEKLKNQKPPLLPKPQIVKLDSKFQKVSSNVDSSKFSSQEVHKVKNESSNSNVGINHSVSNGQTITSVSSKPQLPPKSFVFKSNSPLSNSASGVKKTPPEEKSQTPLRPPRSPQKSFKKDATIYSIKKGLMDSAVLSNSLILAKQKSASLGRNEDLNWRIAQFINDPEELSEFCKKVENCSKHSHMLKKELHSITPDHFQKNNLCDGLNFTFDNNNCEKIKNVDGTDFVDTKSEICNNNASDNVSSETSCCVNGFQEQHLPGDKQIGEIALGSNAPKSFLYSYINSCNQTKDLVDESDENSPEKVLNHSSFLHRNKDKPGLKLTKSRSLGQHDSEVSNDNSCQSPFDQKINQDESKRPESVNRSNSSDMSSFSKRFPWLGSFGKGGKKDGVKKSRCQSQFYSSTTEVIDEQVILRQKSRTKSLPDIKHTRVASDVNLNLKSKDILESREINRMSGESPHSDSDDDKDSLNQVEFTSEKDPSTLAYLKAKELMTSEEIFIDVLKLLNVDFRNYIQFRNFENKNSCIPLNEVSKILNHLSQLQSLNEDILEDLKKRIENWESNPKIADIIVKKGAFLKMYTTYIQNFESQTNYLDECMSKYPKFGKIVKEFEASERCKKLSIKHYMLKPVQRIPQYRLLLNDYVKYLDESSPDYGDTLSALKIVCDVVDHANRNVTHGDKEGRLIHFQSLLSDFELIKPGRELIKDGPLEKICRKTVRDRYFILLNDCLLHTTYSKQYLKIHQELPLSGMKICHNDDQKYPSSFSVHSITKSFILCAKSDAECNEWVETLQKTIEEHIKRQKTFLKVKVEEDTSFKLGKEAPVWVQDSKVTMCQICTAEFTALFRRHHCRGCGKVVCRNCGSNQAPLQYRNFKPDRVCDQCFELLLKDYENSEDNICKFLKETASLNDESSLNEYLSIKAKFIKYASASNWKKQKYIPPRLKEVSANDSQSVISGWLYRKSRKSWKLFWYVLKDHVLYVYKASEDVLASDTIPVLGYEVERATVNIEEVDKHLIFSLVHPCQTPITFRAESQTVADRWFYALTAAANLDNLTL